MGWSRGLTTSVPPCPPTIMLSPKSASAVFRTANVNIIESSRFSSATWKPRRLELYTDVLIIVKVSGPTVPTATVLFSFLSAFIEQTDISTPLRYYPTRTIWSSRLLLATRSQSQKELQLSFCLWFRALWLAGRHLSAMSSGWIQCSVRLCPQSPHWWRCHYGDVSSKSVHCFSLSRYQST